MTKLDEKIRRSIRLLQSIGKQYDGVIEVAYSGGKDSDVILQLAKEAGIRYEAIYKNTTIDPPGTIKHVQEMGATIIRPKKRFFELLEAKGYPNRFYRFCCRELKEYKVRDKAIVGVRREESVKRAKRYQEPTACRWFGAKTEKNHVEQIYPILEWTEEDVREFVQDRGLVLAPIYYRGGNSMLPSDSDACAARCRTIVSGKTNSEKHRKWFGATFVQGKDTSQRTPMDGL